MPSIITVENLKKTFVTHKRDETLRATLKSLFVRQKVLVEAVKGVSFTVNEGEIVGLLGENGAGKSTTIKMLTGVLHPSSGTVKVMGYVPHAERKKYVKHIGAVFGQKSQLIWDIPPLDSFALNQAIYEIPEPEYRERLNNMLTLLDIAEIAKKPTRSLSLGERMKCEFVMAMLHDPRVVFLDEPTIGIDIVAKEAIHNFIRQKNAEGVTFILTTHDLEDIESLARRVIIINHGEKVFEDTLTALRHHLGNQKTAQIQMKHKVDPARYTTHPGITLQRQINEREVELLIDQDLLPINDFIDHISRLGEIQDISIKEIGIGMVIKSIYQG